MQQTYLRGDIYYADLGEGVGSEQSGYRPVVIIQNNTGNRHSPTVIVAAITSKWLNKTQPTHYNIEAGYGLELPSTILLEQLRTLDKRRLEKFVGRLPKRHLQGLNHALAVSVGLIQPMPNHLILCLCKTCADNFRATGAYTLRRLEKQEARELCTYCNHRLGYDYEVIPKV